MKKQKIKTKDLIKTIKQIYDLIKRYKGFILLGIFGALIVEILSLGGMYMFKEIIDALIVVDQNQSLSYIIYLVIAMSLIYFLVSIIEYFYNTKVVKGEREMGHELYLKTHYKLMSLSLGYHEKENTGAKLTKIQSGIESVRNIVQSLIWDIAPTIIRIIASFIFLLFINIPIAFIFISIVPVFLYLTFKSNIKAYPIRKNVYKGFEKVYGNFGQAVYNIKTVQAYAQEEKEKTSAKKGVSGILKHQFSLIKIMFSSNFTRFNLITLGQAMVIISGVYLTYFNKITPGELVFFLSISGNSYWSMYSLSRVVDRIMEAKVSVERLIKVLDSKIDIQDNPDAPKIDIEGEIEFKKVNFDYGEGKVLHNINLKIKPGETIALVGPSGGGKTTLVKLIYRYFDTVKGTILIDGNDIRNINLQHYRKQLGIVSQDIDIFNNSVSENIAYGNPSASMKEIKNAAKIANADEFISKFKKKYKTIVGERGIKLSGGQKQRIGIARAILVNPKVIVLDEATSSLDAESERDIQEAINNVTKNRTTIIIAHRLSTIKNADRILVVEKGKIMEEGTHSQLIKRKGTYSKLVKLQVSGYLS